MESTSTQAVISDQSAVNPHQRLESLALFNPDGTPATGRNQVFAEVVTETVIATAAKTTSSPEPAPNTLVPIRFTAGNSAAAVTVAFDGGSARAVHLGGAAVAALDISVDAGGVVVFWFDGTVLHQLGTVAA